MTEQTQLNIGALPEQMQAIIVGAGQQLELQVVELPQLLAGQVLVKVAAVGVNRADLAQRAGYYPPPAGESEILGLEVAGTVAAVAEPSLSSWLGKAVFGLVPGGGYAQYVRVLADHLLPVPPAMTMTTAAGTAEIFLTAYQAMFQLGELQAGQAVLLHAGASGVGTAAIQLAKARGAVVAVTVGSDDKAKVCRELGADIAVNYKTTDFVAALKAFRPDGFAVIVDPVAGDYLPKNLQLIALDGRIIVLAMLGGRQVPAFDLTLMFKKRATLQCSTLRNRDDNYKAALTQALWREFGDQFASGQLQPLISQVLSWQQADDAHQLLGSNQIAGKLVLAVD